MMKTKPILSKKKWLAIKTKSFFKGINTSKSNILRSIKKIRLNERIAILSLILTLGVSIYAIYLSGIESRKTAEFNRETMEETKLNNKLAVQPILSISTNTNINDPVLIL